MLSEDTAMLDLQLDVVHSIADQRGIKTCTLNNRSPMTKVIKFKKKKNKTNQKTKPLMSVTEVAATLS